MRQGGLKPKSHSSGVYWVRANAQSGGRKQPTGPPAESNSVVIIFLVLLMLPLLPLVLIAVFIDWVIKITKKSGT
jgi:hypothetical protein